MSNLIVDASVAAKWGIREEDSAAALRLLDGEHRLLAPDLIWAGAGQHHLEVPSSRAVGRG